MYSGNINSCYMLILARLLRNDEKQLGLREGKVTKTDDKFLNWLQHAQTSGIYNNINRFF